MSYYPFWTDFKNLNPFDMYYPFQFGCQNQYYLPNQVFLPQSPINSPFTIENNEFAPNYFNQMAKQFNVTQFRNDTQTLRSEQSKKSLKKEVNFDLMKNHNGKNKKGKINFKQKQSRNMISNLFRQALKLILAERSKTMETIQKIAQIYNIEINTKEFMQNLGKKTKNLKNYVRMGQIEQFLKGKDSQKSKQQAKVLRVLINRILRQDIIPCLCNNPKVNNINRTIHIIQIRKLQYLMST